MQSSVAVVTMVRDDLFFLRIWLRHYEQIFGRENLYVINHGRGEEVAKLAKGCNVIGIPGDPHRNFDIKRWRFLNNLVMGLRGYYTHVIVGDVDEIVVIDPQDGRNLLEFLQEARKGRVYTPLGLEVIHRIDIEHTPINDHLIGPRRHVRLAPHYSKPCIISVGTKIARGGHFTQFERLFTPDNLYLLHLKFCDFNEYVAAMNRRNQVTQDIGGTIKDVSIGRHWFAEARGEDREFFDAFVMREMVDGFDMRPYRKRMHRSFGPRGDTGYFHFERPDDDLQFLLPERFNGVL
jgi:hypothetical protein